ncbi:hypothetical protein BpHYR1_022007 [Brachionus plicatilis]|uniref:Uncharacterized protein n=1 Tax=Brachionus plicatilis TaxID=10195 RepID=A0A3M7PN82_BRAPC|nr:hypothetical protein BpHYR1_022007 [Brachionus plicatilis]
MEFYSSGYTKQASPIMEKKSPPLLSTNIIRAIIGMHFMIKKNKFDSDLIRLKKFWLKTYDSNTRNHFSLILKSYECHVVFLFYQKCKFFDYNFNNSELNLIK